MPFSANVNGQYLDLISNHPASVPVDAEIRCCACGGEMHIVNPSDRRTHFRHNVDCTWETRPESAIHFDYKTLFAKLIRDQYENSEEYKYVEVRIEEPLAFDWADQLVLSTPRYGRIADVFCEYELNIPDNMLLTPNTVLPKIRRVYEIQISPITLADIKERTRDYRQLGTIVFWALNEKHVNWQINSFLLQDIGCWYALSEPHYDLSYWTAIYTKIDRKVNEAITVKEKPTIKFANSETLFNYLMTADLTLAEAERLKDECVRMNRKAL